jgi:hypothetical protein
MADLFIRVRFANCRSIDISDWQAWWKKEYVTGYGGNASIRESEMAGQFWEKRGGRTLLTTCFSRKTSINQPKHYFSFTDWTLLTAIRVATSGRTAAVGPSKASSE